MVREHEPDDKIDVDPEVQNEVAEMTEYLRRRVGAMRPPKSPPPSVQERLDVVRKQIELLKGMG